MKLRFFKHAILWITGVIFMTTAFLSINRMFVAENYIVRDEEKAIDIHYQSPFSIPSLNQNGRPAGIEIIVYQNDETPLFLGKYNKIMLMKTENNGGDSTPIKRASEDTYSASYDEIVSSLFIGRLLNHQHHYEENDPYRTLKIKLKWHGGRETMKIFCRVILDYDETTKLTHGQLTCQ